MLAYFDETRSRSQGIQFVTFFFGGLTLASFLLAGLIMTGWVAFGERANISRRDINPLEWIVSVLALLLGLAAARTLYGLLNRERASWAWAQWVSFMSIFLALTMGMYAILGATNASVRDFDRQILVVAIVLLITTVLTYIITTQGADHTPDRFIRIQLAESPSAGAIIGFVAIFLGFSFAADLFFEPRSFASILTNGATKGIIAIGITILMISGEFDLSVGSILGVTAMAFMIFMTEGLQGAGPLTFEPQSVTVAASLALGIACIMGLINGILLVTTRIPSFIVTLGTLFAYRAISLVVIGGGRILRYRDYYSEFPQIYIDRWVITVLPLLGVLFLLYVAYRSITTNTKTCFQAWINQSSNGNFGTLTALVATVRLVITTGVLAIIIGWLGLVTWYHAERIDGTQGLAYSVIALVLLVGIFYANQFRRQAAQALRAERLEAAKGKEIRESEGFVDAIITAWSEFLRDLLAYGQKLILGTVVYFGLIAGLLVALRNLFVERAGSLKVGFFDIANGRWVFTGGQVTRGLIKIQIPTEANFRNAIVWWILLVLFFQLILSRTRYGNSVFAVGGNRGAARAQGINAGLVKVQNFVLTAFLTGIAAILETARNPGVDPLKGDTWELEVIAMTVVGGALLTGGYGSIFGTMLGTTIFGMLGTGLVLVGMDPRMLNGVIGVTLITAVVLNNVSKNVRNN